MNIITAINILESVKSFYAGLDINNILKLYALFCLFCIPFGLGLLWSIYKKYPTIIKDANAEIDRILDGKSGKKDAEKKENKPENSEIKNNKQDIEEENEEFGIANLCLTVGDRYHCLLSQINRQNIRNDFTWSTDNPFVGTIHENEGVFEAKKIGKTYIECGIENIRIYFVRVLPSDTNWFAHQPIMDVFKRINIDNVKCKMTDHRISLLNENEKTISFETKEGTLKYQWDKARCVNKILFNLKKENDNIELLIKKLTEYFTEYKSSIVNRFFSSTDGNIPEDTHYWYHKCGDDDECAYPNTVDFVAFMRPAKNGTVYFGISENWRIGASESEIAKNLEMIERSFLLLMNKEDIPNKIGTKIQTEPSEYDKVNASPKKKSDDAEPKVSEENITDNSSTNPKEDDKTTETLMNDGSSANTDENNNTENNILEENDLPDTEEDSNEPSYEPNNEDGINGEDCPYYEQNFDLETEEMNNNE